MEGQGMSGIVKKPSEGEEGLENFSLDQKELGSGSCGCVCAVAKKSEKASESEMQLGANAATETESPLTSTTTEQIVDMDRTWEAQSSDRRSGGAVMLDVDKIAADGSTLGVPQFFDNFDDPVSACSASVFRDLHSNSKNENVVDNQSVRQDTHGEGSGETLKPNYNNWDQSFVPTPILGMQELEKMYTSDFFQFYTDESVRKRIFAEMDLENYGPPQTVTSDSSSDIPGRGKTRENPFESNFDQSKEEESSSDNSGRGNTRENPFESKFDQLKEEFDFSKGLVSGIEATNLYPSPGFSRDARNAFESDINDFNLTMPGNENVCTSAIEIVNSYPCPRFSENGSTRLWHTFLESGTFVAVPAGTVGIHSNPDFTEHGNTGRNIIEEIEHDFHQINEVELLCNSPREIHSDDINNPETLNPVNTVDDPFAPIPSLLPEMSTSKYLEVVNSMNLTPSEMAVVKEMLDNIESSPDSTGCLSYLGVLPEDEGVRTTLTEDRTTTNPIFGMDERILKSIWSDDNLFSLTGGLGNKDDTTAPESGSQRDDDDAVVASQIQCNSFGNMEREHPLFASTPKLTSKQEHVCNTGTKPDQMSAVSAAVTTGFADVSAIEEEVVQTVGTLVEQVVADLKPCEEYLEEQFQELGLSLSHIGTPESQVCGTAQLAQLERNEPEQTSLGNDGGGVFVVEALNSGVADLGHKNDLPAELAGTSFNQDLQPFYKEFVQHKPKPVRWGNYTNLFDNVSLDGTNSPIGKLSAEELYKTNRNIAAVAQKCRQRTQSESEVNNIERDIAPVSGSGGHDESTSRAESVKQEKKKSGLFSRFTRFVGKRFGGGGTNHGGNQA